MHLGARLPIRPQRPSTRAVPTRAGADPRPVRRRLLLLVGPPTRGRRWSPRGLTAAAALAGRPLREVGLVAATVLVGQALLGWADDLADRERDAADDARDKPLAAGRLDPGTVWFALTCAVAARRTPRGGQRAPRRGAYLALLVVAAVGNRFLRHELLSFVPWVASFALYPAFLAYGGWGGVGSPTPPDAGDGRPGGALGLGVHVLLALPGLVHDHEEGERSFPMLVALRPAPLGSCCWRVCGRPSSWRRDPVIAGRTVGPLT